MIPWFFFDLFNFFDPSLEKKQHVTKLSLACAAPSDSGSRMTPVFIQNEMKQNGSHVKREIGTVEMLCLELLNVDMFLCQACAMVLALQARFGKTDGSF